MTVIFSFFKVVGSCFLFILIVSLIIVGRLWLDDFETENSQLKSRNTQLEIAWNKARLSSKQDTRALKLQSEIISSQFDKIVEYERTIKDKEQQIERLQTTTIKKQTPTNHYFSDNHLMTRCDEKENVAAYTMRPFDMIIICRKKLSENDFWDNMVVNHELYHVLYQDDDLSDCDNEENADIYALIAMMNIYGSDQVIRRLKYRPIKRQGFCYLSATQLVEYAQKISDLNPWKPESLFAGEPFK